MDQYQQALVQMFQMFSGLHKDQMGYLREEMDRQQQITQELRALQAELTKLHAAAPERGQRQAPAGQAGVNGAAPVVAPTAAPAGDHGGAGRGGAGKPPPAQAVPAPGQASGAPAAALPCGKKTWNRLKSSSNPSMRSRLRAMTSSWTA